MLERALAHLVATGQIEPWEVDGEPGYRLTDFGKRKVEESGGEEGSVGGER